MAGMDDVVARVRALLAKARDAGCSESEAEACMLKARRLMDAHGLEEREVSGGVGGVDGVGEVKVQPKYFELWRKILANRVAGYYGCFLIVNGGGFVLVGREASRVVAQDMFEWLDALVVKLARDWRKAEGLGRKEQLNFEKACGMRIAERLREMTAVAVGEGEGGTGLVLRGELDAARSWAEEKYRLRSGSASVRSSGAGGVAGRKAGDGVGLGVQVGGSGGGGVKLLG